MALIEPMEGEGSVERWSKGTVTSKVAYFKDRKVRKRNKTVEWFGGLGLKVRDGDILMQLLIFFKLFTVLLLFITRFRRLGSTPVYQQKAYLRSNR
jgi:hypothetical protein